MFLLLGDKIIYLKDYDIHGTYLSVQMKRKQMQIVKIINWTAIVFFLPHLSITNIVANIPVIKEHSCVYSYTNNYNNAIFLKYWRILPGIFSFVRSEVLKVVILTLQLFWDVINWLVNSSWHFKWSKRHSASTAQPWRRRHYNPATCQ